MNLFIIGNGFDIAHGLKTKYSNFRSYLYNKYEYLIQELFNENGKPYSVYPIRLPSRQVYRDRAKDVVSHFDDEAALLFWLIEHACQVQERGVKTWSDFEDAIMKMNFNALKDCDAYEHLQLPEVIADLPGFLFEWINTINIKDDIATLPLINSILDSDKDLIFTTNYTETMEKLYHVQPFNVCHIHGKRDLTVKDEIRQQYQWQFGESRCLLIIGGIFSEGIHDGEYAPIFGMLEKNVEEQIILHKDFFNKIEASPIDSIYSYGFSYSDVDRPYIIEICKRIREPKHTKWKGFLYEERDKKNMYKSLKAANYQGHIKPLKLKS